MKLAEFQCTPQSLGNVSKATYESMSDIIEACHNLTLILSTKNDNECLCSKALNIDI